MSASAATPGQLIAHNIHKSFGSRHVLANFNLSAEAGAKYAILGPNGVGKTTLMRTMATLIQPDQGRVKIGGYRTDTELIQARRNLGAYFFSNRGLWPHLTVLENWRAHARLFGTPTEVWDEKFEKLKPIAQPLAALYPHQLSLGMRQQALITRCLLKQASVYLLDEPFAVLDDRATGNLSRIISDLDVTVVVTGQTHVRDRLVDQFQPINLVPA